MSVVEVRHVLVDPGLLPRENVHWIVQIARGFEGYLFTDEEVSAPVEGFTDAAGLITVSLTPTTEYIDTSTVYQIEYDDLTRYFTVPDVGPVNMVDYLTTAPSVGVGLGGITGRGITGSYVDGSGHLILTFDKEPLTVDAGAVSPGPQGAQGPAGLDGSGGPVGSAAVASQPVISSGVGVATKFGRLRNDFVDRFGADPTGVADNTDEWEAARTACIAGDFELDVAPGEYLFSDSARLAPVVDGMAVYGAGSGISTFSFTHLDGGLDLGLHYDDASNSAGALSGITIDGNNDSYNPLFVGWCLGWILDDVEVIRGAYNAANAAGSAGVIFSRSGNLDIRAMRVNQHQHHGVVVDHSSAGVRWRHGRIGDCGKAGSGGRNLLARQSNVIAGASTRPFKWDLEKLNIEAGNAAQPYLVELVDAADFRFQVDMNAGDAADTGMTVCRLGANSAGTVFNGTTFAGKSGGGGIIGLSVASGGSNHQLSGLPGEFTIMGTGISLDSGAELMVSANPNMATSVTVPYAGAGVTKAAKPHFERVNNLPTTYDEGTRTRFYMRMSQTNGGFDQLVVGKKGSAAGAHGGYDVLNSATVLDWEASTWYFKGELKWVNGAIRRANVNHLGVGSVNLTQWDVAEVPERIYTEAATGTAKTVPTGYDTYLYTLDSASTATLTVPSALAGTKGLLQLRHVGASGTRPWTIAAPVGTTLAPVSAGASSGTVAALKSDFVAFYCTVAGTMILKAVDLGVTA